jgi:hypothetical protein
MTAMRHVTFVRAQSPFGVGDKRLVSEDVAKTLRGEGLIEGLGEPWPPADPSAAPARPVTRPSRPVIKPTRSAGQLPFQTAE